MDYTVINPTGDIQLLLSGQFTFSDNLKFKHILEMLSTPGVSSLTLDFGSIDFIDSAGLGMLLLLRDECQQRNISISIVSAQGQVHKIFLISKFDQLFSMSGSKLQ